MDQVTAFSDTKVASAQTQNTHNPKDTMSHNAAFADPPPPYPQSQHKSPVEKIDPSATCPSSHSPSIVSAPAYPPQPHHIQSVSRTLDLRYESLTTSAILIGDPSTDTLLYRASLHIRKPHITLSSATTSANVGAASFPTFHTRIDTTAHNADLTLTHKGFLKGGHTYKSKALGGEPLTWKPSMRDDFVCVDGDGVKVAKFKYGLWHTKKCGIMEMLGPKICSEEALDEVVITGLAILYYTLGHM